ncbi:MAG: glutamine amidotransferase, partial [Planctomycetes bacterium]|nr:glutamine amidotransferase [Planctomycetota bacterium]
NLHEALQRELGKRLAAVVLMGDGAQTAFDPTVEIQEAGRELDRLGYPLYAVPYGPVGDVVQARDVAVENLQDQYTVFVKNELPIRAVVRVNGYVNQTIPVELQVTMPDGASHTVGPVEVMASQDNQQVAVELRYVPPVPGRYKLTLRAAEQPGELVTKNNQLSAYLRVLEGGLKVLYLEGELRAEQKFVRRALAASADIDLDFIWIDPRLRDRWPVDLTEPLSDPTYDVFIIGDLDAAALGETNLKLLAEAVERGKGLALLGGYHSFGAGGYRDTPLADVMPIVMDRLERQDFDAPVRQDLHLPGPIQMLPDRDHPIVRLAREEENESVWKSLPPLSGANRFVGVKDAAGTMVIARTAQNDPLLVVGEYGQGRVVAMAADSTWRWWLYGHEAEHKRFWRQMILWLVRRDDLERNEVWIKMAQRRFFPGARVTFTAGADTPTGDAIPEAILRAELIAPDGQRKPLPLLRDADQWVGAIDSVEQPGDYAIEVVAELDRQVIGIAQ